MFAIISDDSYSESQTAVHRNLVTFAFNATSLNEQSHNIPATDTGLQAQFIPVSELGLNSSESLDIKLVSFGPHLLVTDGVKLVAVDP